MRAIAPIVLALAVLFVPACDDCTNCPDSVEFPIHVDSVVVARSYVAGDSIIVRVSAVVGPNLCYKFDHYDVAEEPDEVVIWAVGKQLLRTSCVQKTSIIRGRRLALIPYPPGTYPLTVVQPDYSELKYSIVVVDSL